MKPVLAFLFLLPLVSCENESLTEANSKDAAVETFITYDDLFKNAGPNGPDRVGKRLIGVIAVPSTE
jgi:hypothetical protein